MLAGILVGAGIGCLNVRTPDVQVYAPSGSGAASPSDRYTPYGKELDKVLGQQSDVEKKLKKREWEDLTGELSDWAKQVRRLNGQAGTSSDPDRMRQYCSALLGEIEVMRKATRSEDAAGATQAFERTDPWLNRLSTEFPITEPIPDSAGPGSNEQGARPIAP